MMGVWLGVETLCKAYLCHAKAKSEVRTPTLLQHIVSTNCIVRVRVRVSVRVRVRVIAVKGG